MRRNTSLLLAAGALAVLAALAFGRAFLVSGESAVTEHPVAIPEQARTVTISSTMPPPSAHARRLSAMLEQGTMPSTSVSAEVLSDTDCTPDPTMISRCRNEVRLSDGEVLVLRHPHDMRSIPCLAPGEQVLLVPA